MGDTTPARRILKPAQIDGVASAVLALAREIWVLRDRQIVTEAVLAARGIDLATAIDAFEPDVALQRRLDTERDRLIALVADAIGAGGSG
ncbi:hypothetical protein E2E30_04575 [Sphingomonas sp. AAP5]|uniref:hypothetical protein n=1 Tax=Sphingomonas sp. AAP5 TaxID=1523415 RepID=UPI0010573EFE|nr:hypothetical protein [Sphingomonas sp. AAP5]QBM75109.1 hypothetical protein E2E30_04575 [Sphingomonas sp. AAP5]